MKTRDWARASRKLARQEDPRYGLRDCAQPGCGALVESGRCDRHVREVRGAIEAYHDTHQDIGEGTRRNRKRLLRFFEEFAAQRGLKYVHELQLEHLTTFRGTRAVTPRTWTKELEILRHFFRYCFKSKWTLENPAADVPMPKNLKPADREPYQPNEVTKMLAACDAIGRAPYERLRARAAVLALPAHCSANLRRNTS
jgi:site-specific recombinase XerD